MLFEKIGWGSLPAWRNHWLPQFFELGFGPEELDAGGEGRPFRGSKASLLVVGCLTGWLMVFAAGLPMAQAQALPAPAEWSITLPFELLDSGHMAIYVKLNQQGPFRVIFDTGAPSVMFSGNAAKAAGAIRARARSGLLGGYGQGRLDSVQLGDLILYDVGAEFRDHPTVQTLGEAQGGLEGLVGFPLLNPARMTIDYSDRTIRYSPRLDGRKAAEGAAQEAMRAMLSRRGNERDEIIAPAAYWGMEIRKSDDPTLLAVEVLRVFADSPAAGAGLLSGDRILEMNRRWTETGADFYRAASLIPPGGKAELQVLRGEERLQLQLQPRIGL
jgi:hypothetical protein